MIKASATDIEIVFDVVDVKDKERVLVMNIRIDFAPHQQQVNYLLRNVPVEREALVDFDHLEAFASPPVDDFFCCLGTTLRQAGSREAFRDVDLGYPMAIARMALAAGATRCYFLSAMGANPASRAFYNRTKGELESEMARLPFRTVVALRPSLLAGERAEFRVGERMALTTMRGLSPFIPARYRPIDAMAVARAMLACTRSPTASRAAAARPCGRCGSTRAAARSSCMSASRAPRSTPCRSARSPTFPSVRPPTSSHSG